MELKPSRLDLYVRLLCGLSALYALFISPLGHWPWLQLLLVLIFLLVFGLQLVASNRRRTALRHGTDGSWLLRLSHQEAPVNGRLVKRGFRSAKLLIIVIQSDNTWLHHQRIWHDQVSSRDFSYLHQQLAFAAEAPTRRSPTAWLANLTSQLRLQRGADQLKTRRAYTGRTVDE